jgi:hypothetical protein
MLLPAPPLYPRKRKPRANRRPPAPAPAALTLVSATYDAGLEVVLTFDRAVDVAGFDGTQVIVDDPVIVGNRFDGTGGATLLDPVTVRVELVGIGDPTGTVPALTATAATGIVAAAPPLGGAWAGVTGLELPFP